MSKLSLKSKRAWNNVGGSHGDDLEDGLQGVNEYRMRMQQISKEDLRNSLKGSE